MRFALVVAAVISALTPLLVMGTPDAHACSCAGFPQDEAGIRSVLEAPGWGDAVFAIGVTESRSARDQSSADATVRIERVYRGRIAERVEIRGEGLGGSCDYVPPEVGGRDF